MGTDYSIRCRTCGHDVFELESRRPWIDDVLALARAVVGLPPNLVAEIRVSRWGDAPQSIEGVVRCLQRSHDVALRSEYGTFDDLCSAEYRCACGDRKRCGLAPGHEGTHGPMASDER